MSKRDLSREVIKVGRKIVLRRTFPVQFLQLTAGITEISEVSAYWTRNENKSSLSCRVYWPLLGDKYLFIAWINFPTFTTVFGT